VQQFRHVPKDAVDWNCENLTRESEATEERRTNLNNKKIKQAGSECLGIKECERRG
jgi:hypothetical protein